MAKSSLFKARNTFVFMSGQFGMIVPAGSSQIIVVSVECLAREARFGMVNE